MRQEILNLYRIYFFTINTSENICAVEHKNSIALFFYPEMRKESGSMARKYKRLSYEDRKEIEAMCKAGKKVSEIAAAMDVHRATVYHELARGGAENGQRQQYSADAAQRAI